MIETTVPKTAARKLYNPNQILVISRQIIRDGNLRRLSGDATKVFLYISYRLFRNSGRALAISDKELSSVLDIDIIQIPALRNELYRTRLIETGLQGKYPQYALHPRALSCDPQTPTTTEKQ
jgi:hypothetical protein